MSMLTPPGMGGEYRIKGTKYPRMRRTRRRRTVLLLTAAVALLALVGVGAVQLVDAFGGGTDGRGDQAAKKTVCPAARTTAAAGKAGGTDAAGDKSARPLPEPRTITVNVLNATTRSGLADQTAAELKKRGFKIGEVDNAPPAYDKRVKGAGVVLGPQSALQTALKVVAVQLPAAEVKADDRKEQVIDLILGDAFARLAPKSTADAALAALAKPAPKPSGC
ncbi:LytR C-terminal domain-containing protein [Streptomyces sp. NPDC051940]|uniref:LytR C-terminal domain-containing protein n=1 Tax=Streptomyces sp. NPDC051940 TaxID=3155675 RepID=UPI003426A6E1